MPIDEIQDTRLDLTLEKVVAGGRMLARHLGKVILVRGGIPGERVRVRLERQRRDVAYGVVEDVLTPDVARRGVPYDAACGGNVLAHVTYPRQLALKREIVHDAFARIGRFSVETAIAIEPSAESGYRMRARFHVAGTRIGFLREGSHELCDAVGTGQLSAAAAELLGRLEATFRELCVTGIREIDLAENIAGDQRAVHLWLDRNSAIESTALAPMAAIDGLSGVSGSVARDTPVQVIGGTPLVTEPLAGLVSSAEPSGLLRRHPAAFFQGNRYLISRLVQDVIELIPAGPLLDLYAGVGLFAVTAAASGRGPVVAVEGDPISGRDLAANAAGLRGAARVEQCSVEQYVRRHGRLADRTVIVDPPRTGLSREVRQRLGASTAPRLIYVSCDVATLARDVRALVGDGYRIDRVAGFDVFPNTAHVEVVVMLTR